MFDQRHYVPILRWKAAERKALMYLSNSVRENLTPLVEITGRGLGSSVLSDSQRMEDYLANVAQEIRKSWCYGPVFVDLAHALGKIELTKGPHPAAILERVGVEGINNLSIVPVLGLGSHPSHKRAVASIVRETNRGFCLRIQRVDLNNRYLDQEVIQLLFGLRVSPEQVDLVVDCQQVECPAYLRLAEVCASLPYLPRWRTFTVTSGAFPPNLKDIKKNSQAEIPRNDWKWWRREVVGNSSLIRVPTFGDYTIQSPIYAEPEGPNVSASIRYAAEDYWVIMRGEGLQNADGLGHQQYPGLAQLLMARPEYCGAHYSRGDEYVSEIGEESKRTGNPTTWLEAGLIHHVTMVVDQVVALAGDSKRQSLRDIKRDEGRQGDGINRPVAGI